MATDLTDLIARVAMRDQAAFQMLYTQTSGRLFSICRQILHDHHLAEEALQEAFIQVWHHAGEYHCERGSPLTWMSAITRYRALNILRSRNPREQVADTVEAEEATAADPLDHFINGVHDQKVHHCFETFSQEQRKSLLLAFYHGYSHHEVAARLQSPLGTVKSWIRRGLNSLRRCLS